jgi:hypothetical protein
VQRALTSTPGSGYLYVTVIVPTTGVRLLTPRLPASTLLHLHHAALFNPSSAAYELTAYPTDTGTYTAVLLLRHPSVPSSPQAVVFQSQVVQDPGIAAAALSAPPPSTPATAAAAALMAGPLFNSMSMPRVRFTAQFPAMSAGVYGGVARVLSDYRSFLAATAGLDSSDWVTAAVLQQTPLTLSTTVRTLPSVCCVCCCTVWAACELLIVACECL